MILKCYSSEKLTALTSFTRVSPPGNRFTAESSEAMRKKCLAQGHNILMPGFELSAHVHRNRHSNHMTNMFLNPVIQYEISLGLLIYVLQYKNHVFHSKVGIYFIKHIPWLFVSHP